MGLIAFDQIKCILMVKLGKHRRCDSRVSLVAETFCDLRRKHRTIWNNTFLQIETNAVFQFETNTFLQIETNTCLQIKTSTFLQFETNIKKNATGHTAAPRSTAPSLSAMPCFWKRGIPNWCTVGSQWQENIMIWISAVILLHAV